MCAAEVCYGIEPEYQKIVLLFVIDGPRFGEEGVSLFANPVESNLTDICVVLWPSYGTERAVQFPCVAGIILSSHKTFW